MKPFNINRNIIDHIIVTGFIPHLWSWMIGLLGRHKQFLLARVGYRSAKTCYYNLNYYNTNYNTNYNYAWFLNFVGRPTDAIDYFQRCVRMEPLASRDHLYFGFSYELSGNSDAATIEIKKARELTNHPADINSNLLVLALKEKNRALIDEYIALIVNTELLGNINRTDTRDINEVMYALLDTPEKAIAELSLFLTDSAYNNPFNRLWIAQWASYFGENELALLACRESIESNPNFIWVIWRPIHKGMRHLPGFKDLVREFGLVDYWRNSGKWSDFCHPVGDDDFVCD